MIIRLRDIPANGERFHWDSQHRDLKDKLVDLIGQEAYQVELFIKPQDSFYLMTGFIKTRAPEVCSNCGADIKIPVDVKVNEILIPEAQMDRRDHQAQSSYDFSASGPEMIEVRNDTLNGAEYVHQAIVLALPFTPKCPENCQPVVAKSSNSQEILKNNPFLALKSLKI